MKIILIGRSTGYAAERLAEEAGKAGVEFVAVPLSSVILTVSGSEIKIISAVAGDISDGDCYLFRGIGDADQEVMVIAKYLLRHGKCVIEEKVANGAITMDKLLLRAAEDHLATLDYSLVQSKQGIAEVAQSISYPVVMKATVGSMGRKVALAQNEDELLSIYEDLGPRVIVQEYVPTNSDVRAIVIDGNCVGAFSRTRVDGEFRMNRKGSSKEQIELPLEAVTLCEKAAVTQNIEIAGIDLLQKDGEWHIVEINTSPQFKQFEKKTDVNVAAEIIQHAIEKVGG